MRLRNQLFLYISVYIVIPFLIFASVAIYLVYQSSMENEKEYFTRNIENLSIEMGQYLSTIESNLHIFAQNQAITTSSQEEQAALLKSLYIELGSAVKTIYLIDQNGQPLMVYPQPKEPISFSFENKNCFLQVKKNLKGQLTGVTTSLITKQPTSCIAEPLLTVDGKFQGMVGAELSFNKAQDIILKKGYTNYSYFLLDQNHDIILSDEKERFSIPISFKSLIKNSAPLEITETTFDSQRQYITYSPLKDYPYTIAAIVPEEYFLKSVNQLQVQFMIWVIFTISSVLLLGYLFRKKMLYPLEQFAQITKRVTDAALGHSFSSLNETIEVKNKGELSDLSENFNQMLQALKLREDHLYQRRLDLIRTTVELLELNDPYTAGHSYRVYEYSSLIANQMGLPKEQIRDIETAAILHDIGKIGIALEILNKPGKLNAIEYDEIKQHPIIGSQVLDRIDQFDRVKLAILHHHERYDGKGYPSMIQGAEIPLEARIISVADAFDAMTSNRPYRRGMGIEQAYHLILEEASKQFDPMIVTTFAQIINEQYEVVKTIQEAQEYAHVSYLAN